MGRGNGETSCVLGTISNLYIPNERDLSIFYSEVTANYHYWLVPTGRKYVFTLFCSLPPCTINMILPQVMVLSRYHHHCSIPKIGLGTPKAVEAVAEEEEGAYDDVVVLTKGAQPIMSASPVVVEAEKQKREDDARVNKPDEVEST